MKPARSASKSPRGTISLAAVLVAFAVSRYVVFDLGIRSSDELSRMHMLDRDLLAGDLSRSLFVLHIQPPLFNAVIGLLLKLFPSHFAGALSCVYWGSGLLLAVLMYLLFVRLNVNAPIAAFATLIFIVGPACLLYETSALYDYPTAALLLAAAYSAHRYFASGRSTDAVLVGLLLTAVALMRPLFHLLWVVAVVALVALLRRPARRALLALLVPIALVGLLYAKNGFLFGMFGASSLLGLNAYRISTESVPREERLYLAEQGVVSPFALYDVNHPIDHYPIAISEVGRIDFSSGGDRALLPWGWWERAEQSPEGGFVWGVGPLSVLVLPGARPGPLALEMRCAPFTVRGGPRQTIQLRVNGQNLEVVQLSDGVADYLVEIPAPLLRDSWNFVSFRYGFSRSPKEMGLSADSRRLAVRWLSIGFQPPLEGRRFVPPADRVPDRVPGIWGAPALTRVMRRDRGPNLNHAVYPLVMRHYRDDALRIIRRDPGRYLRSTARAGLIFLAPPMEHPAFRHKRRAIARWDRLYSRFVYGAPASHWPGEHSHKSRWRPTSELLGRVSWISLALALVVLPTATLRSLRSPRRPVDATMLFMLFNILYVAVVGNLLEYGENNRFRMAVEPSFWVVVGTTLHHLARRRARGPLADERGTPYGVTGGTQSGEGARK